MILGRSPLILFALLIVPIMASPAGTGQQPVQAPLTAPATRQAAPPFRLRDSSGHTVALSDFSGRTVVLNIWATECGGCRAELPTFVELHQAYRDQGLRVVGVSMDVMYEDLKSPSEAWARVTPFARTHGMAYTILVDDGSVEKSYKVTAMPATYLIDKHGRIAATYVGIVDSADINANVKALLNDDGA
jgi:peroxiredoxin